jgi:hypothetical protein
MKKINLTIIASILFSLQAIKVNAQIKKGDIIGGINFSASNVNSYDSTGKITGNQRRLNVSPFISYALKNNFTIGATTTLNTTQSGILSFSKTNHNFSTALFARKYIPIFNKFYSYLQADIKYYSYAGVMSYGDAYNAKNVSLNFSGGLGYRISKRIGIELGANNIAGIGLFNQSINLQNGQTYKNTKPSFNAGNVFQANGLHLGVTFKF